MAEKVEIYGSKSSSKYIFLNKQHDFFNFRCVGFLGVCGVASGFSSFKILVVFGVELCFGLTVFLLKFPSDCVRMVYDGGGW